MTKATFGVLLSTAAIGLAPVAFPVVPQQPPSAERVGGGPPNPDIGNRIRGVPQPPTPASEENLPTPHLKLPANFKVETWVYGLMDARSLRLGDKGTGFARSRPH